MSCSRQPTARVRSPPKRIGVGNDPSRSRRQIVVLLNPVIPVTSGSLTTRPPPGGDTERRCLELGFLLLWVWSLIRIPLSSPARRPGSCANLPRSVVSHPRGIVAGLVVATEHTQGDPQPGRGSTPQGVALNRNRSRFHPPRGRASGRGSTPDRSRILLTWAFAASPTEQTPWAATSGIRRHGGELRAR